MVRVSQDEKLFVDEMSSPIGALILVASDRGVHALLWQKDRQDKKIAELLKRAKSGSRHAVILQMKTQLKEYFSGKRLKFDLPLVLAGTPFQKSVWQELKKIPYGKTICYQEQARGLGDIKKVRAVGTANGKNAISIIIPCHRVIPKGGGLGGYGGGLKAKKFLLELESRYQDL